MKSHRLKFYFIFVATHRPKSIMKKYILPLLLVIIGFSSCENTEDNSPALQAEIDSIFFKANTSFTTLSSDGRYLIQGLSANKTITLSIGSNQEGVYVLGTNPSNYAVFEDAYGNGYTTNPLGNGTVTLTQVGTNGELSGTFEFMAVRPGVDTVFVSRGLFYDVPGGTVEEDDGGTNNDGTLSALVNNIPFDPSMVTGTDTGNSIIVSGTTSSNSILIRVPVTVEPGDYTLPMNGFQATYAQNGAGQDATDGVITITSHDTTANHIIGTFTFQAGANLVTSGQFDVNY
jgi:Family of unknown function (DUF6252)